MGKRTRIVLASLTILLIVGVVLIVVLLNSSFGLRTAVSLANRFTAVEIDSTQLEGKLAGPIRAERLTVKLDTMTIVIDDLDLDWQAAELPGTIHVDYLRATQLAVATVSSDEPATEPFGLPDLDLGMNVIADDVDIDTLTYRVDDADPIVARQIDLAVAWIGPQVNVSRLTAVVEQQPLSVNGSLDSSGEYPHDLQLAVGEDGQMLAATVQGNQGRTLVSADSKLYNVQAEITLLELQRWQAEVNAGPSEAAPDLQFAKLVGSGDFSEAELTLDARYADEPISINGAHVEFADGYRLEADSIALPNRGLVTKLTAETDDLSEITADAQFLFTPPDGPGTTFPGNIHFEGTRERFAVSGSGDLPEGLTWNLVADGTDTELQPLRLELAAGDASVLLTGEAQWSPQVRWQVDINGSKINPGLWAPDWPGNLAIVASASGSDTTANVMLEQLDGTFLGRELNATGSVVASESGVDSFLFDATSGESSVLAQGQWAESKSVDLELAIANLGDFVNDAAGSLAGTARYQQEEVTVDLRATDVAAFDTTLASATIAGTVDVDTTGQSDLAVNVADLTTAGLSFETADIVVSGTREDLGVRLDVLSKRYGSLNSVARLNVADESNLTARIESMEVVDNPYGNWQLVEPTTLRYQAEGGFDMPPTCFAAGDGTACATLAVAPPMTHIDVTLDQLASSIFSVPASSALGEPVQLSGTLNGAIQFQLPEKIVSVQLESDGLNILLPDRSEQANLHINRLTVDVDGNADVADFDLLASLDHAQATGTAKILNPFDELSIDSANVQLEVPSLTPYEALVPELTNLAGRLTAEASASGTPDALSYSGTVNIEGLGAQSTAFGTNIANGNALAQVDQEGLVTIDASLPINDSDLIVAGTGDITAGTLSLTAKGDRILFADAPDLRFRASPDLSLDLTSELVKVRGEVAILEAEVERMGGTEAVRPSSDVRVVIDDEPIEEPTEEIGGRALDMVVTVRFADDVVFEGFGLVATLGGAVTVTDKPGEPQLAQGEITLTGTYQAYGQDLVIEEGRLIYEQTPIDNPGLRLDAYREVDDIRAGVRVRGRASNPRLQVFSEPSMEESQALAYLLFGRPLNQTSSGESNYLADAALAIAINRGGGASERIGSQLGFEEFGLAVRDDLGGAAFSVGRYLSPKLYVSYSLGLIEPVDIIELKYEWSRRWSLETEIGAETRAGVRYRVEK